MRVYLSVFVTAALLSGCAANFVKVQDSALGRVVVYRNGVAYYERKAVPKRGRLKIAVPKDKVDDFLKSLTVKDSQSGKSLPVSFPSRGKERGSVVDMVVQLPQSATGGVTLTYITESPAWKPSYRVIVGEGSDTKKPNDAMNNKVRLQTWAVVDNTSGEDWKDVLVGVGSSAALSFRYDLWSIRSVHRETLQSEDKFAIAPPRGDSTYREDDVSRTVVSKLSDNDIPRPETHPDAYASQDYESARAGVHGARKTKARPAAKSARSPANKWDKSRAKIKRLGKSLKQSHKHVVIEERLPVCASV